jgi:hypothetical protein
MKETEIRTFLKTEAMKKIDKDYDILFHLVKDYKFSDGLTFYQKLLGATNEKEILKEMVDNDYLLTIFVPNFPSFSAEKWNISNQSPIVAFVNDMIETKIEKIRGYDFDGSFREFDAKNFPNIPIIVLKTNERIGIDLKNSSKKARVDLEQPILKESNLGTFYFISASLDGRVILSQMFVMLLKIMQRIIEIMFIMELFHNKVSTQEL